MTIALIVTSILLVAALAWLASPLLGLFRASRTPMIRAVLRWTEEGLVADLSLVSRQAKNVNPISVSLVEDDEHQDDDEDYGVSADEPLPTIRADGEVANVSFSRYSHSEGSRGTIEIGVADRRKLGRLACSVYSTIGIPVDIPSRHA